MKYKFPLAVSTWGKEEFIALREVIKSKSFTMGKMVIKFENSFAKYVKSKYALMVNSGSSANLIAIASLFYKKNNPLKYNDEVIVPAISWSTTYYPLHQYGLRLRFVDVDLDTLNYDLKKLEQSITSKTKMVFVNSPGNPTGWVISKKQQELLLRDEVLLFQRISMGQVDFHPMPEE